MDELCFRTKATLQSLPDSFVRYEQLLVRLSHSKRSPTESTGIEPTVGLQLLESEIEDALSTVASNCDRLHVLAATEAPVRRIQANLTMDHMLADCKHLRASLQHLQRKRQGVEAEQQQRRELLASEFTANRTTGPGASVIDMGAEAAELQQHTRLSAVGRRLDEMLLGGRASLTGLKEQQITLKAARKRILDVANTLGLSNTVMRLIERRTHQDKLIFWVLVVATFLLMWAIWRLARG